MITTFSDERKEKILCALDTYGKVSVKEIASHLNVTPETIRKDLDDLEDQYKLKRVHGGAVKISYDKIEPAYLTRQEIHHLEKKRIGVYAASMISDGDVVAIDVGTTTCEILHHLADKKDLTIILNSVFALNVLINYQMRGRFNGCIIFLGGQINSHQMTSFGPISENILKYFYADKAFIAVGGIDIHNGLTGYDINEANLTKHLIENSKEAIVLADHSKIGVRNLYKIAGYNEISKIICSQHYPLEWQSVLKKNAIEWIAVD